MFRTKLLKRKTDYIKRREWFELTSFRTLLCEEDFS